MGLMVLGVLLVLVILILAANIRIVPQAHAYILERLGGYKETWGVGIHFKIQRRKEIYNSGGRR